MARPFVSAGLVASIVSGVVLLAAPPAAAGEGDPPPPPPYEYDECYDTFVSSPALSNKPVITVCTPALP